MTQERKSRSQQTAERIAQAPAFLQDRIDGLTYEDMSEKHGLCPETIKKSLNLAYRRLVMSSKTRRNLDVEQAKRLYDRYGTLTKVARALDTTTTTVASLFQKHGIAYAGRGRPRRA